MLVGHYGQRHGEIFLGFITEEAFSVLPLATKRLERAEAYFFYQEKDTPCYPVFINEEELQNLLKNLKQKT